MAHLLSFWRLLRQHLCCLSNTSFKSNLFHIAIPCLTALCRSLPCLLWRCLAFYTNALAFSASYIFALSHQWAHWLAQQYFWVCPICLSDASSMGALLVMCCLLGGRLINHSNISSEGASCCIAVPPSRASWQGGILCQESVMSNIVTRSKEWDIQQLHRMLYSVKGYHYQFCNDVHHCSLLAAKISKP